MNSDDPKNLIVRQNNVTKCLMDWVGGAKRYRVNAYVALHMLCFLIQHLLW